MAGKIRKFFLFIGVILLLSIVFFNFSCSSGNSGGENTFSKEIRAELEQAVTDNMNVQGFQAPGMVVGIFIPGRGEWVRAFGYADVESGRKMSMYDGFRIGSVTKTFTGTVALQLVEEKKLDLDDTLADLGFNEVPNADLITVRRLLNMTSGLFDYTRDPEFTDAFMNNPTRVWAPGELLGLALEHPPNFAPGERYEYCNTNYILLGLIIEKVTGGSYESGVNAGILEPLGLKDTYFPSGPYLGDEFCRGYTLLPSGEIINGSVMDPSFAWAAGGLVSNLKDMKTWAKSLGTGSLLSREMQEERLTWCGFHDPEDPYLKYCLGGWKYGEIFFGHTGVARGYTDAVYYMPSTGAVFVVLINADFPDSNKVFRDLSKIMYPDKVEW